MSMHGKQRNSSTVYAAVPTAGSNHDDHDNELKLASPSSRGFMQSRKLVFLVRLLIVGFISSGLYYQRDSWWPSRYHGHPTKLPGGGRDWLINVVDGTIVCKHETDLVLGADTMSPLILVERGSPSQLLFGEVPAPGESITFSNIVVPKEILKVPGYNVRVAELPSQDDGGDEHDDSTMPATVSYQDNFIILENQNMVLDIAFWDVRDGSHVNFVSEWHPKRTYTSGGGRDWVWNTKDGTISPKLNPNLVLGSGGPSIVLVESNGDDKHKLIMEQKTISKLAAGETVDFVLENGGYVTQRFVKVREYDGWNVVESAVVRDATTNANAVQIQYDGNYVFVNGKDLVLDVAFWKMVPGNDVNFVGGNDEDDPV